MQPRQIGSHRSRSTEVARVRFPAGLQTLTQEGATMRFTLTISLDDDAAQADRAEAIREALARVAYAVQDDRFPVEGFVRDVNGNTVGNWSIDDR